MQNILLIILILFFLLVSYNYILKIYESLKGFPKVGESVDDVIALYRNGNRVLALRCYRRIYKDKSLKDAVKFLDLLDKKI